MAAVTVSAVRWTPTIDPARRTRLAIALAELRRDRSGETVGETGTTGQPVPASRKLSP